jgi:predicted nicotinamide N-methyase
MPGYSVETSTYRIGAEEFRIRALCNRQQYWDPDGRAERAGISSATWPIFGVVWPAGIALAQEMSHFTFAGLKILEVGCGIGLSSLVLQRQGADITATDYHPLAEEFLRFNSDLNDLPPIKFHNAPWAGPNPNLGRFDLIVGSDLLYERGHPALLSTFLACHTESAAQIILADPGRKRCGQFSSQMNAAGYSRTEQRFHCSGEASIQPHGRMMSFARAQREL